MVKVIIVNRICRFYIWRRMNIRKILPKWLHEYIFECLGAEEKPNPKEFCKNLHSDDEKNRIYLGTYFPRSFAESFCIHDNLFSYIFYQQSIEGKQKLAILSVGCGTGGDVLGALCAIAKNLPNITDVEIVAYDGNNIAIDYLVDLTSLEPLKTRFNIEHKCVPLPITCKEDLEHYMAYMGEGYDLVTSFKFVNELMDAGYLGRDAFKVVAELLAPKLAETGVMTLLDVTDKHLGEWQSKNMNYGLCEFSKAHDEFRTLLPIPCHFKDASCHGASCFTNKRFYGTFTADDKVVYRVMTRAGYANHLYPEMKDGMAYIRNVDNETCPSAWDRHMADGYDINN